MRTKQTPKVIKFPIPKSAMREFLEWVLKNEKIIEEFMFVYSLKTDESKDDKDISAFWTENIQGLDLISMTRVLNRFVEDDVLYANGTRWFDS